jgi:hypothetical protein
LLENTGGGVSGASGRHERGGGGYQIGSAAAAHACSDTM